jgi:hypothetical protein
MSQGAEDEDNWRGRLKLASGKALLYGLLGATPTTVAAACVLQWRRLQPNIALTPRALGGSVWPQTLPLGGYVFAAFSSSAFLLSVTRASGSAANAGGLTRLVGDWLMAASVGTMYAQLTPWRGLRGIASGVYVGTLYVLFDRFFHACFVEKPVKGIPYQTTGGIKNKSRGPLSWLPFMGAKGAEITRLMEEIKVMEERLGIDADKRTIRTLKQE